MSFNIIEKKIELLASSKATLASLPCITVYSPLIHCKLISWVTLSRLIYRAKCSLACLKDLCYPLLCVCNTIGLKKQSAVWQHCPALCSPPCQLFVTGATACAYQPPLWHPTSPTSFQFCPCHIFPTPPAQKSPPRMSWRLTCPRSPPHPPLSPGLTAAPLAAANRTNRLHTLHHSLPPAQARLGHLDKYFWQMFIHCTTKCLQDPRITGVVSSIRKQSTSLYLSVFRRPSSSILYIIVFIIVLCQRWCGVDDCVVLDVEGAGRSPTAARRGRLQHHF